MPSSNGFGVLCSLFLLASLHATAAGDDYFPLDIGNQWYYEDALSNTMLMTITGTELVHGVDTYVRTLELGGYSPQTSQTFFTSTSEGDLFVHGGRSLTFPSYFYCEPPMLAVDGPLYLGKTWVTRDVIFYDSLGVPMTDPMDFAYEVYFEGEVTVPDGTYYCYGIGSPYSPYTVLASAPEACHGMDAALTTTGGSPPMGEAVVWHADGLGIVQGYMWEYTPDYLMKLEWHSLPVGVQATTWGALKSRFIPRDNARRP